MPDQPYLASVEEVEKHRQDQFDQMDLYYTDLIYRSEAGREGRWRRDHSSSAAYEASVASNRRSFLTLMGDWPWERCDLVPRTERILETPSFTADRVAIRAFEQVDLGGILLKPKGAGPRAAVIAQHGMRGSAEQVAGMLDLDYFGDPYHQFGRVLAEQGYVVFAPNLVSGYEHRNWVAREAILFGHTIMGMETFRISRAVDFLQTLPEVIPDRIGFWGLSMGGLMAFWTPAADMRIAASICADFFNHRAVKFIEPSSHYTPFLPLENHHSFFIQGLLGEFSDSDIVSLICPRPFRVEIGMDDKAAWYPMAEREFARAQEHYRYLGIAERCEIDVFPGGHEVNVANSLQFLRRFLPARA